MKKYFFNFKLGNMNLSIYRDTDVQDTYLSKLGHFDLDF